MDIITHDLREGVDGVLLAACKIGKSSGMTRASLSGVGCQLKLVASSCTSSGGRPRRLAALINQYSGHPDARTHYERDGHGSGTNTRSPRRDRFALPKSIETVTTCSGLDGLDSPVEVYLGEDVQEMRVGIGYSSVTSALILKAPSGGSSPRSGRGSGDDTERYLVF